MFVGACCNSIDSILGQLGNRTELELKLLGLAGLMGASAYMVFYISYYAIKCECECKSLERAISAWGISKLIFSKSIVIGGMGILCEILFLLIFGFLSNGLKLASWELLGITAINMFVFAWLGNVLMCIADGIFRTISGNPRQFNYRDESARLCMSAP